MSLLRNSTQSSGTKIRALIMDWDETITESDTIGLVAEAAYLTKPSFPVDWKHFSDLYYSNYKQFTENFGDRSTIEQELKFQQNLKIVELSSVNEYVGLRLFEDVKHETLINQSEKVKIKQNFFKIFSQLYEKKIPIIILSCNWTSLIMQKIFNDHGFTVNDHFKILTNEFDHENHVLTGDVIEHDLSIRTGSDKVYHVKKIIERLNKDDINSGIYYIGDSTTDILPMLETDYGIVIGNGSAIKTLNLLKIPYDEGISGTAKIKHIQNWLELEPLT